MLNTAPFRQYADVIDAIAVGDGEQIIRDVIRARRDGRALEWIAGLSLWTGDGWADTARSNLEEVEAYGSVYGQNLVTPGAFAFIETFRGCPLSCAFCQWGDVSDNAKRVFSTEYLVSELEAIRRLGSTRAFLLDAALNLNPRAFRNFVEAEEQVGALREMQLAFELYPSQLRTEHVDFLRRINPTHIGIGVQSLDLGVLKSLDRPFKVDRLRKVVEQLADLGQVNLEIILGLPGDNPESFRKTLDEMRKFPAYIRVSQCLVLPDALMTRPPPGIEMDYDPITLRMRACTGWSREDILRETEYLTSLSTAPEAEFNLDDSWWLIPPKEAYLRPDKLAPSSLIGLKEPPEGVRPSRIGARDSSPQDSSAAGVGSAPGQSRPAPTRTSPELLEALARSFDTASGWELLHVEAHERGCVVSTRTESGALELLVESATTAGKAFRRAGGVAVSYMPRELPVTKRELTQLARVVDLCAGPMARVLSEHWAPTSP